MEQHIPGIVLKDGLTQPVFDYKRCLFEKVYVETPVDTDGDGRLDRSQSTSAAHWKPLRG